MKKPFIYLAAALLLASCAKNEVSEGVIAPVNSDVIGFNTSTGSTRALDNASADALKSGFTVIGIDKKKAILFKNPTVDATVSSKFMYDATKWKWEKETDDKKWPSDGMIYPLTFIAAYPLLTEAEMGPWATGGAKYTKAIIIDETRFAENYDLLAAHVKAESKPVNGTTTLNFKHLLSKIAFQIVSPTGYKVYIQSVTIKQVAKSGHTYDYEIPTYDAETVAYTNLANYNHVAITTGVPVVMEGKGDLATMGVVIKSNAVGGMETWKLMPQSLTPAWDKTAFSTAAKTFSGTTDAEWSTFLATNPTIMNNAMLEVVYRMEDSSGNSIVGWRVGELKSDKVTTIDKNYYAKVAYSLDLTQQVNTNSLDKGWLPAYSYTYQIKLGTPDATNGTVIDPNYKDDNGDDTDKPIDNPTTKPGEDITKTGSYIGFNVIVDEWTKNENQIK